MKILLVEDDVQLSNDLKHQLEAERFEVDIAFDGVVAEKYVFRNKYDCVLLDINIPGINGYELSKMIRDKQLNVPVIMLTAFGEIEDKLQGFENGADDYITKPFYFKELLARIKVFLKRSEQMAKPDDVFVIDDLVIEPMKRQVKRNNTPIKLTAREYELLMILAEAKGNTVSKKELLSKVWGTSFEANTNTIEVFINLLRNKIDKNFGEKLIKTRTGFGYYLGKD